LNIDFKFRAHEGSPHEAQQNPPIDRKKKSIARENKTKMYHQGQGQGGGVVHRCCNRVHPPVPPLLPVLQLQLALPATTTASPLATSSTSSFDPSSTASSSNGGGSGGGCREQQQQRFIFCDFCDKKLAFLTIQFLTKFSLLKRPKILIKITFFFFKKHQKTRI
jgi:hypothetical protein